jgi:MFS family permease
MVARYILRDPLPGESAPPVESTDSAVPFMSWLLLALLAVAYTCSVVDRTMLSLLVEPIKHDLHLSDTQISLLQGLAFLLTYSAMAIPIGLLVDRVQRTWLVALGILVWSVMTALCGTTHHIWSLFLARAGVGIGEAVLSPAAYSLISDGFPKRRLGLAFGVFTLGGKSGIGLGLTVGGLLIVAINRLGPVSLPLLGDIRPWQMTFFAVGLPGLLVALSIALMPEPPRHKDEAGPRRTTRAGVAEVVRFYRRNAALLALHHLAVAVALIAEFSISSWVAPLFMRVHGWPIGAVGAQIGGVTIVGSLVGLVGGGALSDRAARNGPQNRLYICASALAVGGVFGLAFPLADNAYVALGLYGACTAMITVPFGVGSAALQLVVPGAIRGTVSAIYLCVISMLTMLGPMLVAVVADIFFPGGPGIRYGLSIVIPASALLAMCLMLSLAPRYRAALAAQGAVYSQSESNATMKQGGDVSCSRP